MNRQDFGASETKVVHALLCSGMQMKGSGFLIYFEAGRWTAGERIM